MRKKAVIIGAGLGGLSLGALLSNSDIKPLLFEKERQIGGRVSVLERDGFHLDYGIHACLFGERSAANDVLDAIGERFSSRGAGIRIYDGGKCYQIVTERMFPGFHAKWSHFVSGAGRLKLGGHFLLSLIQNVNKLYPVSVKEWLDGIDAEENVRKLFTAFCIALMASTSLERLSIGELINFLRNAIRRRRLFGYPLGGWNYFLPMAKAVQRGGEMRLGHRVKSILVGKGTVKGVEIDGEKIEADFVVCALPAQNLPGLIGKKNLPGEYLKKVESITPTAGVSIDFALTRRISEIKDIIITVEHPSVGWFTSNLEPSLAPDGMQLLTTFSPVQAEELKDRKKIEMQVKKLKENCLQIFPEMKKNIKWERNLHFVVNGAELNVNQSRSSRPDIRVPGMKNLFLIGDTTCADGAGGEIAINSAKICYRMLQRGSI